MPKEEAVTPDSPAPGRRARDRLWWLDAIRAYAILWVVGVHSYDTGFPLGRAGFDGSYFAHFTHESLPTILVKAWLDYGFLGVNLFVIISTLSLVLSEREAEPTGQWLLRRGRRVLPPYYVLLLAVWLWRVAGGSLTWPRSLTSLVLHLLMLHNLSAAYVSNLVGSLWFVGILLQIYVGFALFRRISDRTPSWVVLAVGAVVGLGTRSVINLTSFDTIRLSLPAYALEAAVGVVVGRALLRPGGQVGHLRIYLALLAIPGILTLDNRVLWPLGMPLLSLGIFGVLWILLRALESTFLVRWLAWVGRYSYGIYLVNLWPVHPVVAKVAHLLVAPAWYPAAMVVLMPAVSIPAGLLFERSVYWVVGRRWRAGFPGARRANSQTTP